MYPIQKNNYSLSNTVRSTFHESTYKYAVHIHQMLELVYVIEGELLVKTRGKRTIAKAGDVVLIHPYQAHGYFTEQGQIVKLWMLLFSNTFVIDIIKNENSYKDYQNAVFTPSPELRAFLESKLFDTKDKITELDLNQSLSLKALLYPIFDEYNKKVPIVIFPNKNYSSLINATLNFLRNNYNQHITIEDCAQAIGYSKSHISHSLAEALGTTFLQLKNTFRIDFAKHLLLNSNMSILNIGLECGFNCQKSFERTFKKALKLTPKEYRAKKLKNMQN